MVHPAKYYTTLKGNELSGHGETWAPLRCTSLSGRSFIPCGSNSVTFGKRQNYGVIEGQRFQGFGGGRDAQAEHHSF